MKQKHTQIKMKKITKKKTRQWLLWGISLCFFWLIGSTSLSAQEEYQEQIVPVDPTSHLISRLSAIEAENQKLTGQLEETQHELSLLKKQVETLQADIEYRLSNPESGTMPLPFPPSSPSVENETKHTLPDLSAEEEYEKARTFLEQGDYEAAERAFAVFVASHPKHKLAGAAQYWLGVTYFVRGAHEKAVTAFAKGYKNYPKSSKGADNLLKLAKSLSALNRTADACTTLDQLISEHPQSLTKEVASERKKLNCK